MLLRLVPVETEGRVGREDLMAVRMTTALQPRMRHGKIYVMWWTLPATLTSHRLADARRSIADGQKFERAQTLYVVL